VEVSGRTWLLADYVPKLGPAWDEVYDENVWAGEYTLETVRRAAIRLLDESYELTPSEAAGLIMSADPVALKGAVEAALFGPAGDGDYRGYSEWVTVSLLANGLDPARLRGPALRGVLDLLVSTGRATPARSFISSAAAAAEKGQFLAMLKK
jgi:hypothetical protein